LIHSVYHKKKNNKNLTPDIKSDTLRRMGWKDQAVLHFSAKLCNTYAAHLCFYTLKLWATVYEESIGSFV